MALHNKSIDEITMSISAFVNDNAMIYISQTIYAILILVIGFYTIKGLSSLIEKAFKKTKVDRSIRSFTINVFKSFGYIFIIIASISELGVDTTSLAAIVAAIGLAIGLALQGSLSNCAAGIMIILFKFFKTGDLVEITDILGYVEDIDIFTVRLRTPDNKDIIIPNGKIVSDKIINYTKRKVRRMDLKIPIAHDDNIENTRKVLLNSIKCLPEVLDSPEPIVKIGEIEKDAVVFYVRPWVDAVDYLDIKFIVLESIKKELHKHKIKLPLSKSDIFLYQAKN